MLLFNKKGQPRKQLMQILMLVGMESCKRSEKAILPINCWAQSNLLRKGERWEVQSDRFEPLRQKIMPYLRELGFVDASYARFKTYQGAIVYGALLATVRQRLHYLIEQWKQGVRFSSLYFLGGERPLVSSQQENKSAMIQAIGSPLTIRSDWAEPERFPQTECEMMQLVWEQSVIPELMHQEVQVYFINAPLKIDPVSEEYLRPITDDTIVYWLKTNPPNGHYLVISNAPYTNRQALVIRAIAPKGRYYFDTIGCQADKGEQISVFLDELARYIFQTCQCEMNVDLK